MFLHMSATRAAVYNGHLRGPVTLIPIAFGSEAVFTTWVCRDRGSNPDPRTRGERSTSTPPRRL